MDVSTGDGHAWPCIDKGCFTRLFSGHVSDCETCMHSIFYF